MGRGVSGCLGTGTGKWLGKWFWGGLMGGLVDTWALW